MKMDQSQTVQAYRKHVAEIPAGKWRTKVVKGVVAVLVAVGLALLIREDLKTPENPFMPWWVYAGGYLGVGYWLSPDFMQGLGKFAVGLAKDILALIRNGKNAAP